MKLESFPGGVFVLTLQESKTAKGNFENRFTLALVNEINQCLDDILSNPDARALVITGGESNKFFSNGHDIAWLEQAMGSGEAHVFIQRFYELMARFMTFPLPTVAAVNGHAFAGGCLLALAQDYRVMKSDRGFICMNEIDMVPVQAPKVESKIKPGVFANADRKMTAVLKSKIHSPLLLRDMYLRGIRFDGKAALENKLVDQVSTTSLLEDSIALAKLLGEKAHFRNRNTVAVLKFESVREFVDVLRQSEGGSSKL